MNRLTLIALAAATASFASAQSFVENFDSIVMTAASGQVASHNLTGWAFQNNSGALGTNTWFNGNPNTFASHQGAGYLAANFNSGAGTTTINNWAMAPVVTLNNGDTIRFFTRTGGTNQFPDRLELRLSTNGASTNVGTGANDVGDFSTLLLAINPNLAQGITNYPNIWTEYTATVSGLAGPTSGRFAFRYHVTDGGPNGANSNYIGIDTLTYNAVPEPMTMTVLALGAVAALRKRRAR